MCPATRTHGDALLDVRSAYGASLLHSDAAALEVLEDAPPVARVNPFALRELVLRRAPQGPDGLVARVVEGDRLTLGDSRDLREIADRLRHVGGGDPTPA